MSTKTKLKLFGTLIFSIIVLFSIYLVRPKPIPNKLQTQNPSVSWSLVLTGDIIPSRSVNYQMVGHNDFDWALQNIQPILKQADLTYINLEAPLLQNCPVTNEGLVFCGDYRFAKSLEESGVDVANLANNHSLNHGWEGLAETEKWLNQANIQTTGFSSLLQDKNQSKLAILKKERIRIGFLGFNAIEQKLNLEQVKKQIKVAKRKVNILIVAAHWGEEYTPNPQPDPFNNQDPRIIGRKIIDWGANVVVGNHPHWIQTIEWYKGKPIFYALGNTVFDQEWSLETKRGILVKLHFENKKIIRERLEIIPIGIKNYGQAYLLPDPERQTVIDRLSVSADLR